MGFLGEGVSNLKIEDKCGVINNNTDSLKKEVKRAYKITYRRGKSHRASVSNNGKEGNNCGKSSKNDKSMTRRDRGPTRKTHTDRAVNLAGSGGKEMSLSVYHTNSRSLRNKIDFIKRMSSVEKPAVIAITDLVRHFNA